MTEGCIYMSTVFVTENMNCRGYPLGQRTTDHLNNIFRKKQWLTKAWGTHLFFVVLSHGSLNHGVPSSPRFSASPVPFLTRPYCGNWDLALSVLLCLWLASVYSSVMTVSLIYMSVLFPEKDVLSLRYSLVRYAYPASNHKETFFKE